MERDAFLAYLDADFRRLRAVAADPAAPVPSCPEWTVDDLRRHVAMVYLHKVECMRRGGDPDTWPPDLDGEETAALLDRSYADAGRRVRRAVRQRPARARWYGPDQTVGFWVRRMAQETVIHRVDAELAAGEPIADRSRPTSRSTASTRCSRRSWPTRPAPGPTTSATCAAATAGRCWSPPAAPAGWCGSAHGVRAGRPGHRRAGRRPRSAAIRRPCCSGCGGGRTTTRSASRAMPAAVARLAGDARSGDPVETWAIRSRDRCAN